MNQEFDIIVLAAGSGKRMNASCNKMFLKIADVPLLYRTLKKISLCPVIKRIFPVIDSLELNAYQAMMDTFGNINKIETILEGGEERSDSVKNALLYISRHKQSEVLLIHDGARPFITSELIKNIGDAVIQYGAALPVMKICETVRQKVNDGYLIVDRDDLITAQTPQAFKFDYINECFLSKDADNLELTDDIAYIEHFNHPVAAVPGEKWNIKITTPEDVTWAEYLLKTYQKLQI
jgi:2-C-methyl-D-erythritol 4-phosphate cytidylyltransferase